MDAIDEVWDRAVAAVDGRLGYSNLSGVEMRARYEQEARRLAGLPPVGRFAPLVAAREFLAAEREKLQRQGVFSESIAAETENVSGYRTGIVAERVDVAVRALNEVLSGFEHFLDDPEAAPEALRGEGS